MAIPVQYCDFNLVPDEKSVLNRALERQRGKNLQELGQNLQDVDEIGAIVFYGFDDSSNLYLDQENLTFIAIVQSHEEGYGELDKGASDYLLVNQLEEENILKSIIQAEKRFESRAEAKYRTLIESTSY